MKRDTPEYPFYWSYGPVVPVLDTIPANFESFKRIFSIKGDIITKKRNKLTFEMFK